VSDYQAIAGVSATLRALLDDRMALTAPSLPPSTRVTVTVSHPDVKPTTTPTGPRLNLFLYEIAHNPFLRNQEIAGPGGPGYPPLALELHYMLTCFPVITDDDQTIHAVLGDAMRVLHDTPVLAASLTRTRGFAAGDPLQDERLRDAYEQVKLSFHTQPFETATKIWSALNEPYRLSVTFAVSALQIESTRTLTPAAPVKEPRILAIPTPVRQTPPPPDPEVAS
jgi:hypothetical protein